MSKVAENNGGKLFSPLPFFLIGFIYYWLIPPIALNYWVDLTHISLALAWIQPSQFDKYYFMDGVIVIFSWIVGDFLGRKLKRPGYSRLDYIAYDESYGKSYVFMMAALAILFTVVAVASGAKFFTGYEDYNILVLGPYATLAFTTILFRNFFVSAKVRLGFEFVFIFSAIMLIGLGSRMLVLLSILAGLLDYIYRNKIRLSRILVIVFALCATVFLMLYVGVVRDGGSIGFEALLGVLLAEPTYTSISFVHYLAIVDGRPVFSIPKDLMAAILNFIPSVIFPEKVVLIERFTHGYGHNPFGANMLLFNLYANFGYFYPIFIILLSVYFAVLYRMAQASNLYRALYFSLLPALLFYIQREGFVTVLKLFMFNGFLLPLTILFITYMSGFAFRAKRGGDVQA